MILHRRCRGIHLGASSQPHAPQKGVLCGTRSEAGHCLLCMNLPVLHASIPCHCAGEVTHCTLRDNLAEDACAVPVEVKRLSRALRWFCLIPVGEVNLVRQARVLRVIVDSEDGRHLRRGHGLQPVMHFNRPTRVGRLQGSVLMQVKQRVGCPGTAISRCKHWHRKVCGLGRAIQHGVVCDQAEGRALELPGHRDVCE